MADTLTFLGTGTSQGIPVIGCTCPVCQSDAPEDRRFRTSAMVSEGDRHVIIDVGPDFRMQMLRTGVDNIEGVLITHEHNDHVAGLDDVRPFNFKWQKDIPIFGRKPVLENIQSRFAYIFKDNKYPGIPRLNLREIEAYDTFEFGSMEWTPLLVYHGDLPVLGFRTGDLTYITDANKIPDKTERLIRGSRILVLNALHKSKHHSHFNLDEAVEIVRRVDPERAYFTHISHRMGLHKEIEKQLPDRIHLAYDGLKVTI